MESLEEQKNCPQISECPSRLSSQVTSKVWFLSKAILGAKGFRATVSEIIRLESTACLKISYLCAKIKSPVARVSSQETANSPVTVRAISGLIWVVLLLSD